MKALKKYIIGLYIFSIIGLFFFSFTQIDLNLTLSRWSGEHGIEKFFQHIGYFQRPLATIWYIFFLTCLFISYIGLFKLVEKKILNKKNTWKLLLLTAAVFLFSYNAFSYDIFNYIFDARIITLYHQNPYAHKALDFPQDHMLLFMRWVQRPYPYGPVWLALTVPLSFIGLQIFIPTFFLFKLLAAVSFIGTSYFIGKTMKCLNPEWENVALIFFGCNPLVLIESLISGHIDIVMAFFAAWAMYLLVTRKFFTSFFALTLSIGVKFATGFLAPFFLYMWFRKKSKISWEKVFIGCILAMVVAVILETIRTNFQPWYLIPLISIAAVLPDKKYILIPTILISFVVLFTYVPFFYTGNWDPPVPVILNWIQLTPVIVSGLYIGWLFLPKLLTKK